jgi:8-oxo-dGTP pyrophosphatase MutT (NUDIX family)
MPRFSLVPAAYVALIRDGAVLLQRRAGTGYMDGYWSFSAAGHVERDESVTAAAVREAREELGVTVQESDLIPICTFHRRQSDRDSGQRVDFFYAATAWVGTPVIREPERNGGLTWAPLGSLPEPIVPHERTALELYRDDRHEAILHTGF